MDGSQQFLFPPLPVEIVFGYGTVGQLPTKLQEQGVLRPIIITDGGIEKAGILGTVMEVLKKASIPVIAFTEVPQDSSTISIANALAALDEGDCDGVIGLGGGSVIDTAKAVAISRTNPGNITAYAGLNKVKQPPLPVIAIPTTAGTGSEVSCWLVFTDDASELKMGVGGYLVFPRVAIGDPDLTVSLPPSLTASTGMDALTHAIESYTNNSYQPISDILALRAMELIGQYLRPAATNGKDREARYGMLLGSMLAGIAMNPTRLGIAHALAMPLGSWDLKIPHGIANGILLPHVMEFNMVANLERFAKVTGALGECTRGLSQRMAAKKSVTVVKQLLEDIGLCEGLGAHSLTEARIPSVVAEAMKSGNIAVNTRQATESDVKAICRAAL